MIDIDVVILQPDELETLVDLYNKVFRPSRDLESFHRRFRARYNVLTLIARTHEKPIGFFVGFELKPGVFFCWFYGVMNEFRRQRVATRLMDKVHEWARLENYDSIRFECHNQHRPMLHLAIALGYDIVGIRWDPDRGDNLVIFEKMLHH